MMVNNINRVIRTTLIVLIICAILLILVKKVVEPVFSDYIAQPIAENIANKASDYLELPPTPESLAEFKQEALTKDWYDSNGQLNVEYRQLPNSTEGTISVSYSETFLAFMQLSTSTNKVIHRQEPHDTELYVSTEEGVIEQVATVYADNNDKEMEQLEETSEFIAENGSSKSGIVMAAEGTLPSQETVLSQETVSSQEAESLQETPFPKKTERQTIKDSAEVISANSEASSEAPFEEHGVALYVDGAYFDAFLNRQDALELAAFVENAKIVDLVTSRVVWESK